MEWQISDQDIQAVEELLLPHGAHFPEDARKVIRWWHSTDVAACPGSGKTTVLLAKLKLLADKMPLENGAGICVLSHTNVAVNEIKNRLSDYADRLLNYPNYIGTIQSFIDRFVTMPYLRNISGQNVQVVDGLTYSADDTTPDWIPQPDFLPIMTSCRFNQEIANVICKLKKGEKNIVTFAGETGVKPVLFVFSPEKIDRVIGGFISALERHELYDINGIYKAIGAIKKEDSAGLKIGSYWSEFDGSANKKNEYSYWGLVDEIVQYLLEGKLYKTEQSVRRLLCRVFHYISIKHPVSEKDYTMVTMKNALDEKYREQYRQWIYEMPRIQTIDRHSVDQLLRQKINELLRIGNPNLTDIFAVLPEFFLEEATGVNFADISEKNVLIDPIRGRRIVFDTIHGVKGETHDATLYLETNRQGATDLNRILPYFGVGRCGSSNLYDSSRKLAYVGMSRPKKLLCVAMQAATYEKSNGVFDTDWEVIDLRG